MALGLVLLGSPPAWAGPTESLQEFFAAINTVLSDPETEDRPLERVARIQPLVAEVSDVAGSATTALEQAWDLRSPSERVEFVTLFTGLIERAYITGLAGRGSVNTGVQIVYRSEFIEGDAALVQTAFRARRGGDIVVEYRMTNTGGRWRVRDLVVDGVSTIENYRAQFRRILGRTTYEDLVGQIRAKLNEDTYIFARSGVRGPIALAPAAPFEIASLDEAIAPVDVPQRSAAAETGASVAASPAHPAPARAWSPVATVSYWVQLAAFNTVEAARRLAARITGSVVVPSTSGRLFLVRVGPFVERAQASVKLHELQSVGNQPFIAEARD
ncbi:MAG: ABC transporter substrate-binding protein [Candidatus Rokuibacteriota bacterium]